MPLQDLVAAVATYAGEHPVNAAPLWNAASFRVTEGEPMPIRRAKALNSILEHVGMPVWPGELLVGIGNQARCVPGDYVSDAEYGAAVECCARIGKRTFGTNSDHHAPDYRTLVTQGFGGIRARAAASLANRADPKERQFLESVLIALDGASAYMRRWSTRLERAAYDTPSYANELLRKSAMMARLADAPPATLTEALQLIYSYHCMMQHDERFAMAFGRLDHYLYPFYRADLEAGRTDPAGAQALFDHFFAKITVDGDVQNIAIGGTLPEAGYDATNEVSFMILEACRRVGRPGGNITARIHWGTSPAFLEKCAEVIRTGIGYPALVNDEVLAPALMAMGMPAWHARDYCFAGCIETFNTGKSAPWSDSRFNLPQCVNLALYNGVDSLTGKQAGLATGEPATWEAFREAFEAQVREGIRAHVEAMNAHKRPIEEKAWDYASPLMSALTEDCIGRARDLNDGGAIYPANHGIAAMGIGVTADSLMAIKRFVYDEKRFTLAELRAMLDADFVGYEKERLVLLRCAPKYGNDNDEVDQLAIETTRFTGTECFKYRTPQGGWYWGLMAANISNIYAGKETGATPDGRKSRQPLSDAASPTFGRDLNGPTATACSVAKLPYEFCPGGNVINVKLHPSCLEGPAGLANLAALVRGCFNSGGAQLQFNTVDREVLKEAMDRPEDHRSLVVRVSGFSAHYTYLAREVQEDILARTEHRLV